MFVHCWYHWTYNRYAVYTSFSRFRLTLAKLVQMWLSFCPLIFFVFSITLFCLLLFVHILLFSLSSYFICRLMYKSCCWNLYCDVYKSELSISAAHLQVRVLKAVSIAL